jgi:AcrR family transcriptional regulator
MSDTRAQRRRAEILEAALDLFAERGYHDTGVADIASRLRMSHGTFYRYFESKRDILDHVIDELIARIAAAVATENAPGATSTLGEYRDQVRRIASALLDVVHEDPRIARLLLLEATGVDAQLTTRILDLLDALRSLTADYLRHGVEQGFLRAELDAVETARALNGMIYAGALHAVRGDGQGDGYLDAALALMFDGVSRAA